MAMRHSCRVPGLVELPERFDAGMNAFPALEHLATNAGVPDVAVLENRLGHRDRSLSVVRGLTDSPLALPIADVPRDG